MPYPKTTLQTLLGDGLGLASADYGQNRSLHTGVQAGTNETEPATCPQKQQASERPEWESLFDDLQEDGQVRKAPHEQEEWRPGSAVGPDWDQLYKRLPTADPKNGASANARSDGDLDYETLFRGDPDDHDLPDLVPLPSKEGGQGAQNAPTPSNPGVPRQQEAQREDREEEPTGPQRRLVFDLDSSLVDLACHWQKYGILGHFNLSGHADEGVEAWGEKLLPKGVLSLADFRNHGVELDLSDTHVIASGFQELEEFSGAIKRDGTVTTLRLVRAKIGNSGASWIAGALMRNQTLTELVLSSNSITDEGIDPIAAVLDTNKALTKIDLSDNRVGSRGAQQLASATLRNRSLTELDLSRNNIGDQGAEEFLGALDVAVRPRPAALRVLDLSGNTITRRTEEKLMSAFHRNITVLTTLRLSESDPAQEEPGGKPPRFTVVCTQQGIEVRAGRPGPRAQVSWEQDQGDVEVVLKRPELRRSDAALVDVGFGFRRLKVTVRGELVMDIELFARIRPDDCAWTVGDGFLQVVLAKAEVGRWQSLTG
ncbi:unnamed protein product [Effrenium voratum]|nr:unnamed protein product [Effrenium voratum]